MNTMNLENNQRGPAERLLDLILRSGAHLWHNRPGVELNGKWYARRTKRPVVGGTPVQPGLHVGAAVELYGQLLEIYQLNAELFARFASYALLETEWRDLKVAAAALLLVQPKAGLPIKGDDGQVAFHDDDYRLVGEAMLLHYQKGSKRMMTPKAVWRVAELLETEAIAQLNRQAGFGDPASRKAPLGRWKSAAKQWLLVRERNLPLLEGLVKAGYKETIKKIARKAGYTPNSPRFFEVLGWKQKQAAAGHREIGLTGLQLQKSERFDGLNEAEICERIVAERLGYKEAVGRLPAGMGLTPAIMAALIPTLSDRDLRIMTPTLESLGLLEDAEIKARWSRAVATATDQRALNVAKNVRSQALREQLEQAADHAVKAAVAETIADADLEVMFLIDKSGSMEGAIEASKEALSRILAGFPPERLHIAAFDTVGTVLKPKNASRAAVQHMLQPIKASGGTVYGAGVIALHRDGLRMREGARLIVIAAGDEEGEQGRDFGRVLLQLGFRPAAFALILSCRGAHSGRTVRDASAELRVPYSEIDAQAFEDPYQVTRALKAMLDAPVLQAGVTMATSAWLEKVLKTPLLQKPVL